MKTLAIIFLLLGVVYLIYRTFNDKSAEHTIDTIIELEHNMKGK